MNNTHQLALALFEDMAPIGEPINRAPSDIGFHRNNIFFDIAHLSLSGRRAIDVAYFIVAQDPVIQRTYEVDMNFFKWLMAYSSNNRKHLRTVLREGQKAAVQVHELDQSDPDNDRWVSVPLLGSVGLSNGKLYFEVPDKLQAQIKSPASSHFLSLRFVFKSVHAKIIYDRLQPYLDENITPWYTLDEIRGWINCNARTYDEYKYLKRNVLEIAVKHINEVSNLDVSYNESNLPGTKKVGKIRFKMKVRDAIDTPNTTMRILTELYDTLQNEFGLSKGQFNEIIINRDEWTDVRINQAIEYTRFNIGRGKVKSSAAGYLMKALSEHYVVGSADRLIADQSPGSGSVSEASKSPVEAQHKARLASKEKTAKTQEAETANRGMLIYKKLSPEEKQERLNDFCHSDVARVISSRTKYPQDSLGEHIETDEWIKSAFGAYMATKDSNAPVV